MKNLLTILTLLISIISFGQTNKTLVNPALGNNNSIYHYGAIGSDSVDYKVSGCGAPTINMLPYMAKKRGSAEYIDTCANLPYYYSPSTNTWYVSGGGSGNQPLTWDATMTGTSPYDGSIPRSTGADTINYIATKSDLQNGVIVNPPDTNGTKWAADTILRSDYSGINGHYYLIWNEVTGTQYLGHEQQIMHVVGSVPNYQTASIGDFITIANDDNATSIYQLTDTGWANAATFWIQGLSYPSISLDGGTGNNKPIRFFTKGKKRLQINPDGQIYEYAFKNSDSSQVYSTWDANGQIVKGHFVPQVIYVDSVSTNAGGDSLIVYKNSIRYAYKLPSGGGGSGTVTSVASADGSITVTNPATTVDLSVVKSPKLTTARTIGTTTGDATTAGSTFDGTANNTNALTLATVNSNVGSFGDATHVGAFTVNGKGLVTAASSVAITGFSPTFTVTAPITYSANVIGITQSATGANGYLSSTDWNTFNGKLSQTTADARYFQISNNLSEGTASAMRTSLGLGSLATLNTINNSNWSGTRLSYSNFTAPSTTSLLFGRGTSSGDWQEISLGTNLSMTGTTLNAGGGGSYTAGRGLGLATTQFYHDTTQSLTYLADQIFENHAGFILKAADTTRSIRFSNIGTQPNLANIFITPLTGGNKEVSVDINFAGTGQFFYGDSTRSQLYFYSLPYDSTSTNEEAFLLRTTGRNGFLIANRARGAGVLSSINFDATGSCTKAGSNLILNTDKSSLFQGNVGIGILPSAYSNYSTLALAGTNGGLIDFVSGSTKRYEMYNNADVFHLFSFTSGADAITLTAGATLAIASNTTITGTTIPLTIAGTGGGGLKLGAYSSSFGGFWSAAVTPSTSNYALIASSSVTALNTPSGGTGRIFVNDATIIAGWTVAGFYVGRSAITPTALLHLEAGTGTAGTAPLKLTSGTNLTTPEAGAFEYNGTNLFFTRTGTTRESILSANSVNTVSPTSPNRTITVVIDGTTYYLAAKTTND